MIRETREETAWLFHPESLIGIYRWIHPTKGDTYMRYTFSGNVDDHRPEQPLDTDIHQALWLTIDEIEARQADLRSALVLDCFHDYLNGRRYPLDILRN